jgi:hypothetical protein
MQIKEADDKQPQIEALKALLARPDVDRHQRGRIESEIRTIEAGQAGERDAAYQIEFYCGNNPNYMTIHDLRIECNGRVAQIDHLLISRLMEFWVCESKSFREGVAINERGEWSAYYGRRAQAIPSPIEQNRRHIVVLREVFSSHLVPLPTRLGITLKPEYKSLILVSSGARITRPRGRAAAQVEGLDSVIKADQLASTINRAVEEKNPLGVVKLVDRATLETLARRLAALHTPETRDWAARFGLPPEPLNPRVAVDAPLTAPALHPGVGGPSRAPAQAGPSARAAACATCGRAVSQQVVDYCQTHAERFGGVILCMRCQARS